MKTQGASADCSQPLEGVRQEGREVGVGPRFVAPALVFWKALIILYILLHNPRSSSGTCQTSGQDVEFGKLGSLELQIEERHSAALHSERLYKMERKANGSETTARRVSVQGRTSQLPFTPHPEKSLLCENKEPLLNITHRRLCALASLPASSPHPTQKSKPGTNLIGLRMDFSAPTHLTPSVQLLLTTRLLLPLPRTTEFSQAKCCVLMSSFPFSSCTPHRHSLHSTVKSQYSDIMYPDDG